MPASPTPHASSTTTQTSQHKSRAPSSQSKPAVGAQSSTTQDSPVSQVDQTTGHRPCPLRRLASSMPIGVSRVMDALLLSISSRNRVMRSSLLMQARLAPSLLTPRDRHSTCMMMWRTWPIHRPILSYMIQGRMLLVAASGKKSPPASTGESWETLGLKVATPSSESETHSDLSPCTYSIEQSLTYLINRL